MVTATAADARRIVSEVLDPELPVVTISELGILREVRLGSDGSVEVVITPTYSGCPAMDAIRADIRKALTDSGFSDVRVETVLSPPWSTDWISESGREKLRAGGIAPPGTVGLALSVKCPQCGSLRTSEVSRFGSTACKALWRCDECAEPFEFVKPL